MTMISNRTTATLLVGTAVAVAVAAGCGDDAMHSNTNPDGHRDPDSGAGGTGVDAATNSDGGATEDGSVADLDCAPTGLPDSIQRGNWDSRFTVAGLSGHDGISPMVHDFARDTDGSILAAGYFQWLGTQRVEPLVRYKNGQWEPARTEWNRPVPRGGFRAMAVQPRGLALATNNGYNGPSEIWLDTGGGFSVVGHADGPIRSLAWYGGKLWAAGTFFSMDGTALRNIAVWDGTAWSAPPGGGPSNDGLVYKLFVSDEGLFVGGAFDGIGGIAAKNIAAWNGSSWKGYPNDELTVVFAFARGAGGELFAGGFRLDRIAGGITRWTGANWEAVGGGVSVQDPAVTGVVSDLAFHDGALYATGCFTHVSEPSSNPSTSPARSFARWNGSKWESLDAVPASDVPGSPWANYPVCGYEGLGIYDVVHQRLWSDGPRLLAGGGFAGAGTVPSQSLIAYDGRDWIAQGGPGDRGLNGSSSDIAVGGPRCAVHVLGSMSHAGGKRVRSQVIRYDDGWTELGDALPSGRTCGHMAVDRRGAVFVGCASGGGPFELLKLDGANWRTIGRIDWGDGGEFGSVHDMKIDSHDKLWVVGATGGDIQPAKGFVARWDDDHFTTVENSVDGAIRRIAFPRGARDEEFVVGGTFTHIGHRELLHIARWDGANWSALGPGIGQPVSAVEYGRNGIYASTEPNFTTHTVSTVARWDGARWADLTQTTPGLPAERAVDHLLEIGNELVLAGTFDTGSPTEGRGVYVYEGSRFVPLKGGIQSGFISTLTASRDALWFGGPIAVAGGDTQPLPTAGIARFHW
ncbi:hypothetical protein LZC95_05545 [Pendulispora brunnea]|uniref:Uncharacterized protein n=1 Tax=Pendulispora brunnea TaxID=2905690 RepID=A0ABZ2KCB1_9BACT